MVLSSPEKDIKGKAVKRHKLRKRQTKTHREIPPRQKSMRKKRTFSKAKNGLSFSYFFQINDKMLSAASII